MKGRISFLNRKSFTALLLFFLLNVPLFSQLPTAQEIAAKITVGWNMGNTLEAIGGETAWGGAYTTQELIDFVKASGFNTVRLPCSWFGHSDTTTNVIDSSWIARVKQVVDYCINDSLYVVLNIHWDNGWLENRVTEKDSARVNKRQHDYWTQIANYFKDYDEHLLFAGTNEPNVDNAKGMSILLTYLQTFINAVRATGGNNSSRTLVIQGPSTDIDKTNNLMKTFPTDQIADRLILEVHYYTPYQFTLMTADAGWGKMFYYWGKNNHSTTDVTRNSTWGEEGQVDLYFNAMKTKFVDKGIPVIIGEFGSYKRNLSPPSDQELNNRSVEYYDEYVVKSAIIHGLIPYYWDTNKGIFDRGKIEVADQGVLDAIMKGAEEGIATSVADKSNSEIPNEFKLEQNYPNPFNPSTTIEFSIPSTPRNSPLFQRGDEGGFTTLKVYDLLGREITTLVNEYKSPGNYSVQFNAAGLPSGIYFYSLNAGKFHSTKKLLLLK